MKDMERRIILITLLLATAAKLFAYDLQGIVRDSNTGEPLVGTTIKVKELATIGTTTGLDGTFSLRRMPDEGRYTIIVSYTSYKTQYVEVDVKTLSAKAPKGDLLSINLEEDTKQISEVIVTGHKEHHSDRSALELTKTSTAVLNVTSQQSIQLSPDINVSNVLQRVSGVTLEQSSSANASYAILRGMDKRYNYTLVNGVKIPSPDDKNRYIPLNIFPADLMDRLVVAKSLTADMEGDAAGGVVDMVMKNAPMKNF